MKSLRDSLRGAGYNLEEAYFARLNFELIQKLKNKNRSRTELRVIPGGRSERKSDYQEERYTTRRRAA